MIYKEVGRWMKGKDDMKVGLLNMMSAIREDTKKLAVHSELSYRTANPMLTAE
jgi:hypothetical protein